MMACVLLIYRSLLRQASYSARSMELLIRIARMDAAMRRTGKKLALAAEVRMTLIEVEQSGEGRVKHARRSWLPLQSSFSHNAGRLIIIETLREENFFLSFHPFVLVCIYIESYTLNLYLSESIYMECARCQSHRMRRIKREGFLHKWLAPLFGYYPWRCSSCHAIQLLKSRGKKRSEQEADGALGVSGGHSEGQTR
jgi:hypothetical protein